LELRLFVSWDWDLVEVRVDVVVLTFFCDGLTPLLLTVPERLEG
jgi:hypothetical protein